MTTAYYRPTPATPSPRRESTQRRRRRILDAALHCFDIDGVAATKIEDIRLNAGVSVGSLYHHFPSKEAIAAALYLDLMARYQRDADKNLGDDLQPRPWIRAAIDHHAQWSMKNPSAARFFLAYREPDVIARAQPMAARLNHDWEERVAAWLDKEVSAGRVRAMQSDIFIAIVIGPIHRFVRRWAFGSSTIAPVKVAESLADAAWRAVRQSQL